MKIVEEKYDGGLERVTNFGKNILENFKWFYERQKKYDIACKLLEEMKKKIILSVRYMICKKV